MPGNTNYTEIGPRGGNFALKKAVAIYRQAETVMLESPVRDSKANGAAAVRSWAAQFRVIRHHVERRLKTSIPKDSPMMTWLVSWAADVIPGTKFIQLGGRATNGSQAIDAISQWLELQKRSTSSSPPTRTTDTK